MFLRWLKTISTQIIIAKIKNSLIKNQDTIGKTIAELIEPTLTFRVIKTNINPKPKHINASLQSTANTTPIDGATPLPALNL